MTMLPLLPLALLTTAALDPPQTPRPAQTPAARTDIDDARRAAAGRLLEASRFRDRQRVLLPESLRAAQAELASECIDRAAEGRGLDGCRSTASLSPTATARLSASQLQMLDEVMVASQTVYARTFTAAEMDEITRFFRTPVGQKYGRLYPGILTDITKRKTTIARRYLGDATRGRARP